MRIFDFLHNLYIVQLYVQVLIHRFENAADLDIVFELDRHLVVDEGFEEAEEQHLGNYEGWRNWIVEERARL